MKIANSTVLVTGANRGIGRALVEEALRRGAKRVYAGTRQPLAHPDGRVTPLTLDVTNAAQIQASRRESRVSRHPHQQRRPGALRRPQRSCRARTAPRRQPLRHIRRDPGLPAVADSFSGSHRQRRVASRPLPPLPLMPAYSISKAAAFSLSQSLRALLGRTGRERSCRPDRPRGHRYDPRPRHPEGLPGVRCASHLRRRGERGGGHLPRSHVGVHGRELAQRCGQGARAPECGARSKRRTTRHEQYEGLQVRRNH